MKILKVVETPVKLEGNISNALVNFSSHTVSALAIITDQVRHGKPVIGLAFNSIGRFDQSGIIRSRMIPRLMQATPDSLLDSTGQRFSPENVLSCILKNEKPGGHGDRAQAASAIELAIWEINARLDDEPVSQTIAKYFDRGAREESVAVYAAGGYYYDGENDSALRNEIARYQDAGFTKFKMKIGGADLKRDMQRIEAAIEVAGSGQNLAVDANGRFSLNDALAYASAMQKYKLWWFEEAGDPLDFELNAALSKGYSGALATGENLFSHQDVKNLVLFGGARPDRDIFQMDPGLSYGVSEYVKMIDELETRGFDRRFAYPHGGQLMGLHVVSGLGLGGCETYPNIFQPMGGFGDDMEINEGRVSMPSNPGFGFESKSNLIHEFVKLLS
ncbi:enolase C-terminal domain-like protein [Polynucleobacter sinensis]|uniref:enolase C-terminal domain-like protein n=1 Tax=Polynucleobacter sinensis TaxID=1743157 RepID=UPI000784D590|nr:enolase C-terminal domain-like protein [Polynucleobacter sinensis]